MPAELACEKLLCICSKVTLSFATLQRNRGSRAQTHKNSLVLTTFVLGRAMVARQPQPLQMSAVETGQMSSAETRQVSTGKTGRCPASPIYICLVSAEDICPASAADICPVSAADTCPVSTEGNRALWGHLGRSKMISTSFLHLICAKWNTAGGAGIAGGATETTPRAAPWSLVPHAPGVRIT